MFLKFFTERDDLFIWAAFIGGSAVFCMSLYGHLYAEDFVYLVESTCDPAIASCYVRDCESDECPPNQLSTYQIFAVSARDFASCEDNSCANICATGVCTQIACSDYTDECLHPETP